MKVRDLIKRHEGLRLIPYKDTVGRWTVGYGHNLDAHGDPVPECISPQQAEDWLEADVARAERACSLLVPGWEDLDEVRRAVLTDMCFNLGAAGLVKFVNLLKAVKERNWGAAAMAMFNSRWAVQVGKRADRLGAMMETGEWPDA